MKQYFNQEDINVTSSKNRKIKKSNRNTNKHCPIKRKNSSQIVTSSTLSYQNVTEQQSLHQYRTTNTLINDHNNVNLYQILYSKLFNLSTQMKTNPHTLNQTFRLLKRYIHKTSLLSLDIDIMMLTTYFIACKFYEKWSKVFLRKLIIYCQGKYSCSTIIQMEAHILQTLNFQIFEQSSLNLQETVGMQLQ